MSNPNASSEPGRLPRWLVLGALAGFAILIGWFYGPFAGGADSSGYFNSARLFTEARLTMPMRTVPELGSQPWPHFVPLGFVGSDGTSVITPTYPCGLPLHFAIAGLVLGWSWGATAVGILTAVGAVVCFYLCAREMEVSPFLAAAGSVALGASPMFLFIAVQPLSDLLAMTWCTAAMAAALRARKSGVGAAVFSGVAFSIAVLVRPSDFIMLPALMLVLWHWRRLFAAGLGAIPGGLWMAWYQNHLYGDPLRSGYGDIFGAFATKWFEPTMALYGSWLPRVLPLCVLVVPLAAFLPWRRQWRELSAMFFWGLSLVFFYAFYSVTHEVWWCMRFILPAFPPIVLLAVLGLDRIAGKASEARRGRIVLALACVVAAGTTIDSWWGNRTTFHPFWSKIGEEAYADATRWSAAHLPPQSIVATLYASGAFYFYTDFPIVRWDTMSTEAFANHARALLKSGRPFYAVLLPLEAREAFDSGRVPGTWEHIADVNGAGVWKLTALP
jgi:hypothetical protein